MTKDISRRTFVSRGVKVGIVAPFLATSLYSCGQKDKVASGPKAAAIQPLKILILGGTSFLGPHQIAYALNRGHSVSTFTRGKTKPTVHTEIFKDVEQLIGDRENDLKALEGRKWDLVIDNSGRNVEWTQRSAALLKDSCGLYMYTSSTGVFYPYVDSQFKEGSPINLKVPEGVQGEEKLEYDYGVMKANSELAVISAFGKDKSIIVRPTYMFGPGDRTDRFIYWPVRLEKGGQILVPGKKDDPVQYMDVRDVAEWMIRLGEEKKTGTFNAVGPREKTGMLTFLEEAKTAFSSESSFVVVDDYEYLESKEIYYIVPWIMPTGKNKGSSLINNQKAINNGLTYRPLKDSIMETLDWWNSDAVDQERRDKLVSGEKSIMVREADILKDWASVAVDK